MASIPGCPPVRARATARVPAATAHRVPFHGARRRGRTPHAGCEAPRPRRWTSGSTIPANRSPSSSRSSTRRRTASRCRRTMDPGTTRSVLAAVRARTMSGGRSRTIANAGTRAAAARIRNAFRASCVTFVASTTVRRPARRRRSSAACRAANAALVADWSAASPEIAARRASDERISSGPKWRAASVDLPDPAAPTRRTSDGSRRVSVGITR